MQNSTSTKLPYTEQKYFKKEINNTSTLWSNYVYKFIYGNIIPPFLLYKGSVERKIVL